MAQIDHCDRFHVGHPMMDADHRMLAECMNLLFAAVKDRVHAVEQSKLLLQLIERTRAHFRNEEELMRKIAYCGLDRHKSEHDMLLEEIEELHAHFKTGQIALTESLFDYLDEWLAFHAVTTDKKLAEVAAAYDRQ